MDITLKDLLLLVIGSLIGFFISWLFYKLPYNSLASYYLDDTNEFYYEYKNGFNLKRFAKRNVNEPYNTKISKKEFLEVKGQLQRRGVD